MSDKICNFYNLNGVPCGKNNGPYVVLHQGSIRTLGALYSLKCKFQVKES